MSATRDDGGTAFPCEGYATQGGENLPYEGLSGMSLRDYFAGKALEGWLAGMPSGEAVHDEAVARRCFAIADAMLKARAA